MTPDEFDAMVEQGFLRLPSWVRERIENVAILVEDEPGEEDRTAQKLEDDETLLGLYKGVPLSARGDMYGVGMTLPDTITLYREPILDEADYLTPPDAPDEEFHKNIAKVIAETIWHEFGHHFGLDEDEVRKREDERDHGSASQ